MLLTKLLNVTKCLFDKVECFLICGSMHSVFVPVKKGKGSVVVPFCVCFSCGKLVADAFDRVFIWHKRQDLAVVIIPIFYMMLVSAFMVKPGEALSRRAAASADRACGYTSESVSWGSE